MTFDGIEGIHYSPTKINLRYCATCMLVYCLCLLVNLLAGKTECLNHTTKAFEILSFHVIQELTTADVQGCHTTLAMLVLAMSLQVSLELLNTGCQGNNCNREQIK